MCVITAHRSLPSAAPCSNRFARTNGDPFGRPLNAGVGNIGLVCANNVTCVGSNGYCKNGTCACLPNFIPDLTSKTCRIAPGYNEPCAGKGICREAFVCNASKLCDCPKGFVEEYLQCVRDCPKNQVPVNGSCLAGRELSQKCQRSEQCLQTYSECHKVEQKCKCIPGTVQKNGYCQPVNQCPMGKIAMKDGKIMTCSVNSQSKCGPNNYCMFAELNNQQGYCCPKIRMKCPIGEPLPGKNCTSCPWDTHHCFSYVVGSYTDSMCCPNACPSSLPIRKSNKCYARSAFGAHCMIDDQCYSVVGSLCRPNEKKERRCLCPPGPFFSEFGQCLRKSFLNETCRFVRECHGNTQCIEETCTCLNGWVPAPDGKTCIPQPTCPVPSSRHNDAISSSANVRFCGPSNPNGKCGKDEFCHPWWTSIGGGENGDDLVYAQCCPKPKPSDFDALCKPYGLTLMLDSPTEPKRCDLANFQQPVMSEKSSVTNTTLENCPAGSACLFDPYTVTKGVCCKPLEEATAKPDPSAAAAGAQQQGKPPGLQPNPKVGPPSPKEAGPSPPEKPASQPEAPVVLPVQEKAAVKEE